MGGFCRAMGFIDRLVLSGVAIGAVGTLALTHIWNKCPQPAAEPKPCEQEESAAEAELVTARDLAEQALKSSPDEQITGLIIGGQPGNPLHFSVQGSSASQYNNALAAGEKPLVLTYFAIQGSRGATPDASRGWRCVQPLGYGWQRAR